MNPARRPTSEKNSLKKPLKKPRNPNKAKTPRRIRSTQFTAGNRLQNLPAVLLEKGGAFRKAFGIALEPQPHGWSGYNMFCVNIRQTQFLQPAGHYPSRRFLIKLLTRLPSLRPATLGITNFMTLPRSWMPLAPASAIQD